MKAPFKLPWIPIAAVSGAAVLILAIVFRDNFQASTWKEIAGGTLIGLAWAALSERKACVQHIRNAWQWWRRTRPWGWETVRDTRITRYQVHPSGRRRVVTRPEFGYQPIDRKWEKTGEWSTWEDASPLPKSAIRPRSGT